MPTVAAALESLPDVLAVTTIASSVIGAAIGTFVRSLSTRQFLENIALGAAIGLVLGGLFGFALWGGAALTE